MVAVFKKTHQNGIYKNVIGFYNKKIESESFSGGLNQIARLAKVQQKILNNIEISQLSNDEKQMIDQQKANLRNLFLLIEQAKDILDRNYDS